MNKNGSAVIFLDPVQLGEPTKFRRPTVETEVLEDGINESEPDDGVLKWLESVWDSYDLDSNGTLDKAECWKFIRDHLQD